MVSFPFPLKNYQRLVEMSRKGNEPLRREGDGGRVHPCEEDRLESLFGCGTRETNFFRVKRPKPAPHFPVFSDEFLLIFECGLLEIALRLGKVPFPTVRHG
jgi:hypothetical protein